jgi:hypothetical protein
MKMGYSFAALRANLSSLDFNLILEAVKTIADECDSQLKQTIVSFSAPAENRVAA